jgi:hypothetical protein
VILLQLLSAAIMLIAAISLGHEAMQLRRVNKQLRSVVDQLEAHPLWKEPDVGKSHG